MPLIQAKSIEDVFTPTQKKRLQATSPTHRVDGGTGHVHCRRIDAEKVFSDEWEIGGVAMTTDTILTLMASEIEKPLEGL